MERKFHGQGSCKENKTLAANPPILLGFILFSIVCIWVYLVLTYECRCAQGLEASDAPGSGVIGCCELADVGAGS